MHFTLRVKRKNWTKTLASSLLPSDSDPMLDGRFQQSTEKTVGAYALGGIFVPYPALQFSIIFMPNALFLILNYIQQRRSIQKEVHTRRGSTALLWQRHSFKRQKCLLWLVRGQEGCGEGTCLTAPERGHGPQLGYVNSGPVPGGDSASWSLG